MPNDAAPSTGGGPADQGQPIDQSQQSQETNTQSMGTTSKRGDTTPKGGSQQPPKTQPPTKPNVRKYKVDGNEVEFNLDDEKEVVAALRARGLERASFDRMRQAAEEKKRAEALLKKYEEDPLSALENPNLSDEKRRELIEKYYQKKWLEAENLTPEQRRIRELEAEIEKGRQEREEREQAEAQEREQKLQQKWQNTYQQQIIEAIEKGKLAKNAKTAARVAFFMGHALEAGFEAPIETIIQQVKDDVKGDLGAYCGEDVPIETIVDLLGPKLVKRLRQYDLEQYKKRQAGQLTPVEAIEEPEAKPEETEARRRRNERPTYAEVLKRFG